MKNKILAAIMAAAVIASSAPAMVTAADVTVGDSVVNDNGSVTTTFADGTKETWSADGGSVIVETTGGGSFALVGGTLTQLDKVVTIEREIVSIQKGAIQKNSVVSFTTKEYKKAFNKAGKAAYGVKKWKKKKLKWKLSLKVVK